MFRINYLMLGHRKGYLASLPQTEEGWQGFKAGSFCEVQHNPYHPSSDVDDDEEVNDKRKCQEQNEIRQQLNASALQIKNDRWEQGTVGEKVRKINREGDVGENIKDMSFHLKGL